MITASRSLTENSGISKKGNLSIGFPIFNPTSSKILLSLVCIKIQDLPTSRNPPKAVNLIFKSLNIVGLCILFPIRSKISF